MTTSDEPVPKRRRVSAAESTQQAGGAGNVATSGPIKEEARSKSKPESFPETRGEAPSEVKGEDAADSAAAGVSEDPLVPERVGAFTQRELFFLQQEECGNFSFQYLLNDGQPSHNIWLVALKNIFSRQLPNMPKEYITRLVLDRRHRSVAVVRRDGSVVGGITYRPFHSQGFGEIAFCAVSSSDQVKGFGSRLMSYTKEYAKERDNLSHFLTYADNNAVTFFSKQGFTTDVTLGRERWMGYIKDYDGGTLMESILYDELPYTRIPQMLKEQRAALGIKIRGLSTAHVIYPGLAHFNDPDALPLEPQQIPGVEEAGWTPAEPPKLKLLLDGQELPVTAESIRKLGQALIAALKAHEDSPAFVLPVRAEEVPDYYDIIKDPMDLSKIEKRLESGNFYVSLDLLRADIRRIWKNAHLYNAVDTYWHKAASRLEHFVEQFLASCLVHVK